MENNNQRKGRNWKAKYLTIKAFNEFLKNDWKHLNWKVNAILVLLVAIIAAVIAKFITG